MESYRAVKSKSLYCPKEAEVDRSKRCFFPPPIPDLISKLEAAMRPVIRAKKGTEAKQLQALLSHLNERYADSKWLVHLLGIWKAFDEIFQAGYKYVKAGRVPIEAQFNN